MDPFVVLAFLVVGLLQIAVPVVVGFFLAKKFNASWKIFALGAGFFVLVQVLHIPLVLSIQTPIGQYLNASFSKTVAIAIFALILGLLAGLFEEIGRFLVFKYFFKRQKTELKIKNAFMFGAGWGGIESAFIGVTLLLTMFSYIAAAPLTQQQIADINAQYGGTLTGQQVQIITKQNETIMNLKPLDLLPSLAERLMTLSIQIAFTLLVFSAVVSGRKTLLLLAILWHAALDSAAVFLGQTSGIPAAELSVFVFAIIGLLYIKKKWPKKNERQ